MVLGRFVCVFMCVCVVFILLYIVSTACVDLLYFCFFDMKNVLMDCMKLLHICNICQCIVESNLCVCLSNPPGLPRSRQLVYGKQIRPLSEMLYFGVLYLYLFVEESLLRAVLAHDFY